MAWPPLWSPSVQAMLSEVLRAGPEPTAGLSHLSTPDSILMSYQILKASAHLHRQSPLVRLT